MNDKIKVGIVGCGFVGGALKAWLEENNKDAEVFVSDPPKGYNDDLSEIDIAFLQIHVPTEDDGTQNLELMKELIRKFGWQSETREQLLDRFIKSRPQKPRQCVRDEAPTESRCQRIV